MEGNHPQSHAGAERSLKPMASSSLEFDLTAELEQLHREEEWTTTGRNSKTLVKHPDFRIVLTIIRGNTRIREHHAEGLISVQTIAGHLHMHIPERTVDLPMGHLLVLDRALPHDVEALEDSAFLLTIAWPEGKHKS